MCILLMDFTNITSMKDHFRETIALTICIHIFSFLVNIKYFQRTRRLFIFFRNKKYILHKKTQVLTLSLKMYYPHYVHANGI